jgi:hypothetical protein
MNPDGMTEKIAPIASRAVEMVIFCLLAGVLRGFLDRNWS